MSSERILQWTLRAGWMVLAIVAGPAFAAALDGRSAAVQTVGSVGLWAVWAIVLGATFVSHPISLTVFRCAAPAAMAASVVALGAGASTLEGIVAIVATAAVTAVAFLPETAMPYVNGPAYANERRFPLRPPGPVVLGPLELGWAIAVGFPAAGALLLASRQWIGGAIALALGLVAAVGVGRSMYGLARRWVVFVPAGLVVHDPMTLSDPILLRRRDVAALDPAPADTKALDLTAGAFGLALEITARETATLVLARRGSRAAQTVDARQLLIAPTRPGAVLTEARARRFD